MRVVGTVAWWQAPGEMELRDMVKMLGLDDVRRETRALLEMEKDVVSGAYSYRCPVPGRKLCVDLYANEDKSLKFYLDIFEGKRSSSIVVGLAPSRKTAMQNRLADTAILRIDRTDEPDTMVHRNPDGKRIVGSHMHIDINGSGAKWAVPLSEQTVILAAGGMNVTQLFWSFLDVCHINMKLEVEQSLGV